MEFGKAFEYEVHIIPTPNFGTIVKIGCQRFAFTDIAEAIEVVDYYVNNPEQFKREFYEGTEAKTVSHLNEAAREDLPDSPR